MHVDSAQMKVKEEESDCDEKDEHLKWVASMKDSIQVKMWNLNITVRSHDETNAPDTTDSKYSGRKNFKKFVKVQQTIMFHNYYTNYYFFNRSKICIHNTAQWS